MNPGRLDRLVTLYTRSIQKTGTGEPVEAWVNAGKVWAQVNQVSGQRAVTATQDLSLWDYQITIRWRAGITATSTRLAYEGMTLEITKQPAEVGRRAFLEMLCRAMPESTDIPQ